MLDKYDRYEQIVFRAGIMLNEECNYLAAFLEEVSGEHLKEVRFFIHLSNNI